jgi:HK97 family phage major capsid protein
MSKYSILTRSALLAKDPEVQRLYHAMAQREAGSDIKLRAQFDRLLRGELEYVRQRAAVITGAGLGAALIEEIAVPIIDLTTAYSAFKTLNVQTPWSGKSRFPVAKVLPDAVAEAPFLTPSSQGTQLTPVATLIGGGEETESRDLPILIEVSNPLLEDERADLSFALPSLMARAAANRVDWAAFSADGTDDIQDGQQTGIFQHGDVASVTAADGHTSVETLDEEDILRTVDATADGALQRGTRWWLAPSIFKKLLRLRDGPGARLVQFQNGQPFLVGSPVTLVGAAPSTNAAGEKILAFGCGDAALVAIRRDIGVMISDGVRFDYNVRQFRAVMRVFCQVLEPTWFSVLKLAAA